MIYLVSLFGISKFFIVLHFKPDGNFPPQFLEKHRRSSLVAESAWQWVCDGTGYGVRLETY